MHRRLRFCACLLSLMACVNVAPAAAKILLRVAPGPLPPARHLGISEVVLPWPLHDAGLLANLRALGFRVFLETSWNQLAAAVDGAERAQLAGVIVDQAPSDAAASFDALRFARVAHPRLLFRVLIFGGKQPQMRGRLVVDRGGILQVSSPSSQPWLDTNLAAVRLAESFQPDAARVLYDFHWDLSAVVQKEQGPSSDQYALAISEAEAIGADVIVDLPEPMRAALVAKQPTAWTFWNQVQQYIAFSTGAAAHGMNPIANMGVVVCNQQTNFEAVNLLARHNLSFETIRPQDLNAAKLNQWNSLVVFCAAGNPENTLVNDFAKRGGIVVVVNQDGAYPWHLDPPTRHDQYSATFTVGSGEIVELKQPFADPETFARDLRRLIGAQRSALSLWNSLTTLVMGYRLETTKEVILHAVNYADVPDNVQIQIKGRFVSVQMETPEDGCCLALRSSERGGFTEFTIPRLVIAARVRLKPADAGPAAP